MPRINAVRAVAILELLKGAVVLLTAAGVFSLIHRNVHEIAVHLVEHAHLNPASKYPQIFIEAASHFQDSRLVLLALGAAAYSAIRFVEGYGLFNERAWAEVLASVSGAVYVPIELWEIVRQPSLLHVTILLINLGVVAIMVRALLRRRLNPTSEEP